MNFNQQNITLPIGSITAFAGEINTSNTPENNITPLEELGWLVCDGRTLETSLHPQLFAVLGYLYGGSGNHFKIPDLRGMFLRGVGEDPASNESRTKASGGEDNGVGSTQDFAVQKQAHVSAPPTENIEQGKVKVSDLETRPINTFVYYILKYRS